MKLLFLLWAPIFVLTLVSCDSGGSEDPNPMDRGTTAAKIDATALRMYFIKIKSAAQKFRAVQGVYPVDVDEMVAEGFLDPPSATDPWGNPWVLDTSGGELTIITYGADGQPGGDDANRDRRFQ